MRSFIIGASLTAALLPTMPVMATTTTTAIVVALRGDGYCPDEKYSSDPDCAREGAQWRGSGRVGSEEQDKSSRDQFPECRASGGGQQTVYTCKGNPRNEFPGDRPRQPRHLG